MTQLSINHNKKAEVANIFKALFFIPFILLICIVSSCSKDYEDTHKDYMTQLYEESQTLEYQTADSIEAFTQKFYEYLVFDPGAYNHPYYSAIDEKIYENSPKCFVLDTDWDGENIVKFKEIWNTE